MVAAAGIGGPEGEVGTGAGCGADGLEAKELTAGFLSLPKPPCSSPVFRQPD